MSDSAPPTDTMDPSVNSDSAQPNVPAPLSRTERRILGVLMEKARTTPEAYPLTLNGLVTGCNQKSNRHPLMNLTSEEVEDALLEMRQKQLVAEVHTGGRVPKFRHLGYDYMGVKGVEAAVMTELLLRGGQTAGDLRSRSSRFEPIADLATMQDILNRLIQRGLVVALTPPGRGQMFSHNLYEPRQLVALKSSLQQHGHGDSEPLASSSLATPKQPSATTDELQRLQAQVAELQTIVADLKSRIEALES